MKVIFTIAILLLSTSLSLAKSEIEIEQACREMWKTKEDFVKTCVINEVNATILWNEHARKVGLTVQPDNTETPLTGDLRRKAAQECMEMFPVWQRPTNSSQLRLLCVEMLERGEVGSWYY